MQQISLTKGHAALVDDEDFDVLTAYGSWCASVRPHTVYAMRGMRRADGSRGTVLMHTVLTGWPLVDHRDGNGLNNQRSNLRPATKSQNACNSRMRPDNLSGYRGVSWSRTNNKWRASIYFNRRRIHLGYHESAIAAAVAYDQAAAETHGEFAVVNFPLVSGAA